MKRIGMLAVVTLLAAAGCSKDSVAAPAPSTTKGSTATASPGSSSSGTPSVSAASVVEFTVDGAGPYQLGAALTTLQAAKSLDEVTVGGDGCPENTTARGTGVWKDVRLSFRKDGKLYLAVNKSPSIPTPSGAWLGTTVDQLKAIYVGVTGQDLTHGADASYLVTTLSGGGIRFDLDTGKRVISMSAGDAASLRNSFQGGTPFC